MPFDIRPFVLFRMARPAVAAMVLLFGCGGSTHSARPGSPSTAAESARIRNALTDGVDSARARSNTDPVRVVDILFNVVRVDLPADGARHSRKIWNHVDELRMEPGITARLASNGLRVGTVSEQAWPAIRAILDACHARTRRDQLISQAGLPVSVAVSSIKGEESIFLYGQGSRLTGKTFRVGEKIVNVHYGMRPDAVGMLDVEVSFEVRHDRGGTTWENQEGILRQIPDIESHLFEELTAILTLRPAECLVIGSGDKSDNEYLPGSRFFRYEESGAEYESMLYITPQVLSGRMLPARPS